MKQKTILLSIAVLSALSLQAQDAARTDSVPNTKEVKNRNVMLNASSDNQPRQISIGLPSTMTSNIFEDGLPVSYYFWPSMPFYSWKSGVSTVRNSVMSMGESAIRYGNVNYTVSNDSRLAGDELAAMVDYNFNHYGKQAVDVHVSTPISQGWGVALSAYQNFDPGSNPLLNGNLQSRQQLYKAGINKFFDQKRGEMSLLYIYANRSGFEDTSGPFVYHAKDGSVTPYEGFNMGHDAYMSDLDIVEYMDIKSGEMRQDAIKDMTKSTSHQIKFNLRYELSPLTTLNIRAKYKAARSGRMGLSVSGISQVTADKGYTYMNRGTTTEHGQTYEGAIENRFMRMPKGRVKDLLLNAELTGRSANGAHSWRIGLDEWRNHAELAHQTAMTAHEAKKSPKHLLLNGNLFYNINNAGEYYDGDENKLALYLSDDWTVNSRLWLSLGTRLEWMKIWGKAALETDATPNQRFPGWSLKDATLVPFDEQFIQNSVAFNGRYTLLSGFGLVGEYVFNRHFTVLEDYAGNRWPSKKPVLVNMARGGIYLNNSWIQLTSQITYISQTTYKARMDFKHTLTKDVNGMSAGTIENIAIPVVYDVATLGWTTDFMLTPVPHFTLHGLFTMQNPQYKNFVFNPVFSDGVAETHDFSQRNVTAMSKYIVEIDPTYTNGPWRVWLSARFQSKQYINKTNSLYFKGRWETFGGVSYTLNKHVSFDLNVVNILNQKGASGSIGIADLIKKEDLNNTYDNYVMSGSYIRPFTVEGTVHLRF